MPVERVKITSSNITLKNSSGNVIFNTDYKYLKTSATSTFNITSLSPTVYVYRGQGYDTTNAGAPNNVTITALKNTGLTIDYIYGNDYLNLVDRYSTYPFTTNGNIVFGQSTPIIIRGSGSPLNLYGNIGFNSWIISPYYLLYTDTGRYLCAIKLWRVGILGGGTGNNQFLQQSHYFPFAMPLSTSQNRADIIRSIPVFKGEKLRFLRTSTFSFAQYTGVNDSLAVNSLSTMKIRFNSGTTTFPLVVA